jgi:hypothetical protein
MTFKAEPKDIEGHTCYVFPEGTELPEAFVEMIQFANNLEKDVRPAFYVQNIRYELEVGMGSKGLTQKRISDEDVLFLYTIMEPKLGFVHGRLIYGPEAPEPLEVSIGLMIYIANQKHIDVVASFDPRLVVKPGDQLRQVRSDYLLDILADTPELSDTPEVRTRIEAKKKQKHENREKFDALMEKLPDFTDANNILYWLEEMGDCLEADFPGEKIIDIFAAQGFFAGANCEEDFAPEDEDNCGRWLIGQFLNFIRNDGVICRALYYYTTTWRKRFRHK